MGINTLTNLSTQEITANAGASITSGDLLVNTESGSIYGASNVLTVAQNNNTTAGTSAIAAISTLTGTNNYYNNSYGLYTNQAQLTNGTVVIGYTGNGTTITTGITLQFKNIVNGNIAATLQPSTAAGLYFPIVRALPNGGVVVSWTTSSIQRYAIYTSTGGVTKAATDAGTISSGNSEGIHTMNVLTGGNIVFAYVRSGTLYYQIVNSSGTSVLAETTVEASSTPTSPTIRPLSAGGFVIYYYNQASNTMKFARYNASGTIQGTLTTISNFSQQVYSANYDQLCQELSNGNLLFIGANASGLTAFAIYDSSGSSVKAATVVLTTVSSSTYVQSGTAPGVCTLSGGGFAFVTRGSSYYWTTTYDNTGGQLIGVTQSSQSVNGASGQYQLQLVDLGNNFAILSYEYSSGCSTQYWVKLWTQSKSSGTLVGSVVSFFTNVSTIIYQVILIPTADGSVAMFYANQNSQPFWGTYAVQRKSILGVAQNTVSSGSNVRIGTVGTYTINSSFGVGGAFDQRTATVPGAKGTVVGTTAVLFGLS